MSSKVTGPRLATSNGLSGIKEPDLFLRSQPLALGGIAEGPICGLSEGQFTADIARHLSTRQAFLRELLARVLWKRH